MLQGSVATRFRCGELTGLYRNLYCRMFAGSKSARICKIYQYLVKVWTRVWSLIFWPILYDNIVLLCLRTPEMYLKLNII